MAKRTKKKPATPKGKVEVRPPTAKQIIRRVAEIRTQGYESRECDGVARPPVQRRYIEAQEFNERALLEGDFVVYDVVLRTSKHLTRGELNEALCRGFSDRNKTSAHNRQHEAKPYRCGKCSEIVGYPVIVSVCPCPACAERKWQTERKSQN